VVVITSLKIATGAQLSSLNIDFNVNFLYYIRNQQDATLAVSFISHYKITLHVSDSFCVHHQEYYKLE